MEADTPDTPEVPQRPPKAKRPSLAFSWATLGFILGALFVIALPPRGRDKTAEPAPAAVAPAPEPEKKLPPLRLSTIENVFEVYAKYAVWTEDTTEVALFDPDTNDFTDCYQVVRADNGAYFFRTIPRLDRPILGHGVPDNAPLRFTETEEQRQVWLRAIDEQNFKALHP